jgi:hypothetical protein
MDIVVRAGKLFDRKTNTDDQFTSPIKVKLVRLLDFADIPQAFKRWVVAAATRSFYDAITETIGRSSGLMRAELDAKRRAMNQDGRNQSLNIFNQFDVGRTVLRRNPLLR